MQRRLAAMLVLSFAAPVALAAPPPLASVSAAAPTYWHPDPDDDGIPSASDPCPLVHHACDLPRPTEGGPVVDLHVQHVTPYGAWLGFTSPRTEQYGWGGWLVWSTSRAEVESGGAALVARGESVLNLSVEEPLGLSYPRPIALVDLAPATTYYAAILRDDYVSATDRSNVVTFTTTATPTLTAPATHPKIAASPEILAAVRSRSASGDARWQAWADEIGGNAITYAESEEDRDYCASAKLLHLATGEAPFLDAARKHFEHLVAYWETTEITGNQYRYAGLHSAFCLDLMWDDLTAEQRVRAARAFLAQDERELAVDSPAYALVDTDEGASRARTWLADGLLLCGETSLPADLQQKACTVRDQGLRWWFGLQLVKARRPEGTYAKAGGTMPDGIYYGPGTTRYWMQSFWVLSRYGVSPAEYSPFVRNVFLANWLYATTPSEGGLYPFGDIENVDTPEPGSFQIRSLAGATLPWIVGVLEAAGQPHEAAWARWYAERLIDADDWIEAYPHLLWEASSLAKVDPRASLPRTWLDASRGMLIDRTSWSANASLFGFECGPNPVDHALPSCGHFQLYRRGQWVMPRVMGYDGDPGHARGYNAPQLEMLDGDGAPLRDQAAIPSAQTQRILRSSAGGQHTYAKADLTGAYTSPHTVSYAFDKVEREIVWLRSDEAGGADVVVVLDRIRYAEVWTPRVSRQLLFHFDARPDITGRVATVQDGEQRVELALAYPASATLDALAPDPGAEPGAYDAGSYTHRVRVEPRSDARELVLLSLVRASDGASVPPISADAIEAGGWLGALGGDALVLFAKDADAAPPTVVLSPVVTRVFVTGLVPAAAYSATVSGGQLAVAIGGALRADGAGVLALAVAGGTVSALPERGDVAPPSSTPPTAGGATATTPVTTPGAPSPTTPAEKGTPAAGALAVVVTLALLPAMRRRR